MSRLALTDRFTVQDEDGNSYEVREYTSMIDTSTMGDSGSETEGLKEFRTSDGQALNVIDQDEGIFELVSTGQTLRRI